MAVTESLTQAGVEFGDRLAILLRRGAEAAPGFFSVIAVG
jgi:hypothetical protein